MARSGEPNPAYGMRSVIVGGVGAASLLAAALLLTYLQTGPRIDEGTEIAREAPTIAPAAPEDPAPAPSRHMDEANVAAPAEMGEASWYEFDGEETANGEIMDSDMLTAAHPTLPAGTRVLVENVENGQTVVVRINDRGPYAKGRIIDVSKAAAERLDMIQDGVATVRVWRVAGPAHDAVPFF